MPDSPEELVRLFWESCWNERRTDRLAEIFPDPFTFGDREGPLARLVEVIEETAASSSDLKIEIRSMHSLGPAVVTRTWLTGTHTGPLFGVPATGKPFRTPNLDVFIFREGKVEQYLHLSDHLPILGALGAEIRVGGDLADLEA